MDFYANGLNRHFLRNVLPGESVEVDWVKAAIAYGSDQESLLKNCLDHGRRLDIWMRYDQTVPVSPPLLRKLLESSQKNIFCKLVPDVLHAKVIWWKNYGAYIGSANLTNRAWDTNIEFGVFLSEIELEGAGALEGIELFFDELEALEKAFPLTQEIVEEQERISALRSSLESSLDKTSWEARSIPKWGGPNFVRERREAAARKKEIFLREWNNGLTYLRDLAEQAPDYRPRWMNADAPASWQADQFLHAYYYNVVVDGPSHPFEKFFTGNRSDPSAAVKKAFQWWAGLKEPPSDEDHNCHERAPIIRRRLARENMANIIATEFAEVCAANHSTADHVRRMTSAQLNLDPSKHFSEPERIEAFAKLLWTKHNVKGESIVELLMHVLDGGEAATIPNRLFEAVNNPERKFSHFGTNQIAEIAGWARPEVCPPRNGRTSKALKALGFDVQIY